MDPPANCVDKLKSFAKSSKDYFNSLVRRTNSRSRGNPIEILKRLQQETFSDLMKLRDRQDKVERMLSIYKTRTGSPFQEASTHVKGEVDVVGSLLFVENIDQEICDIMKKAGVRTGVNSKLIFETTVRKKDTLSAEFMAKHNSQGSHGDVFGSPLTLKKVTYLANVNDWFSAIAIPVGAQFKDVGIGSDPLQSRGLTDFSSFAPPLLDRYHGCAAGLMVRGRNVFASLAEFVSWLGMEPNFVSNSRCLSTFAQVTYQPVEGTKMTLLGLQQKPRLRAQNIRLDSLTIPISSLRFHGSSFSSAEPSSIARNSTDNATSGSLALMLETELDESARIGGWVELQKSNTRNLQWAVCLSDTPEDELGWGMSIGGSVQRPLTLLHFQFEAFLKFTLGKRFNFQPGLVYALNERRGVPALVFRSSWSL
ncbi:hypothetical protein CKAN_01486500 [Cinnamomum micranthum f. kanehirae]|uniref:Bacterial surface antigen (D15) domain-containing protein n=1 Tax=Cinnamomum micranthum f. kanehirae TaxID=337451 RepID=A0A3S3P9C7_9MAGN|nr:hypothetical protein CKAN_01486500 [Cinnamomum micranthum f. kanehirae]